MTTEEEEVRILRELDIDFDHRLVDHTNSTDLIDLIDLNESSELPISFTVADTFEQALQRAFASGEIFSESPNRPPSLLLRPVRPFRPPQPLSRFVMVRDFSLAQARAQLAQPLTQPLTQQLTQPRAETLIPVSFSGSTFPEGECAICFDGFQNSKVVYVPCQPSHSAHKDHVFHYHCLIQWVHSETAAGRARTCPLCRALF